MRRLHIALLFLFSSQILISQEILVKNLEGEDMDFNKILEQSEKDQPTILITWAEAYCGSTCEGKIGRASCRERV